LRVSFSFLLFVVSPFNSFNSLFFSSKTAFCDQVNSTKTFLYKAGSVFLHFSTLSLQPPLSIEKIYSSSKNNQLMDNLEMEIIDNLSQIQTIGHCTVSNRM